MQQQKQQQGAGVGGPFSSGSSGVNGITNATVRLARTKFATFHQIPLNLVTLRDVESRWVERESARGG